MENESKRVTEGSDGSKRDFDAIVNRFRSQMGLDDDATTRQRAVEEDRKRLAAKTRREARHPEESFAEWIDRLRSERGPSPAGVHVTRAVEPATETHPRDDEIA